MQHGGKRLGREMAKVLARASLLVTPERHVWACANTLIQQYGEDAWFHASLRADQLLVDGDQDGHAMFKAILARVEELQKMQPTGTLQ